MEALQSGAVFGFAGQVDGLVDRIIEEIGPVTAVVATGGLASVVIGESETITHMILTSRSPAFGWFSSEMWIEGVHFVVTDGIGQWGIQ